MPNYIRAREGNMYFFTVVTWRRQPILCHEACRTMLREAISEVRQNYPFDIAAWVLLPDHMHCIWNLPKGDTDYSRRWGMIKAGFTRRMKRMMEKGQTMKDMLPIAMKTKSQKQRNEGTLWQRRFWEHTIRDERDFNNHCDYIHFNPVKHGLVSAPSEWPWSTFHRFVEKGIYPRDWGGNIELPPETGRE